MKYFRFIALAVTLAALQMLSAQAAVMHGHVWQATYVVAYQPTFRNQSSVPRSGTMELKFNHGIISGTFTGDSVRPDPLNGRIIGVNGNVSSGNINLTIAAPGGFTVRGTIDENGTITGTATVRGSFFTFMAKVKSSP
jgi:hypothetical protein